MDEVLEAPPESEEPRHYIVKSDDDDLTDVGLITVRYESRHDHWVKFPDGQTRKRYNAERITKADMELLDAFQTMPRLKVSYRPIRKFFKEHNTGFYMISFLVLLLYALYALIVMVAGQFGFAMMIIDSGITSYINIALLIALPVTVVCTYLSNKARRRWNFLTPDDIAADRKQEAQRQFKKQMVEGISNASQSTLNGLSN